MPTLRAPDRTTTTPRTFSRSLLTAPAGRRSKYAVLLALVAVVLLAAPWAGQTEQVEDNGPTSMLPRGYDATAVAEELAGFQRDGVMPTAVVYERDDGPLGDADLAAVEADRAELTGLAADGEVSPVRISDDGSAALLLLGYDMQADFDGFERLRDIAAAGLPRGLDAHVTGPSASMFDFVAVFGDDLDFLILGVTVGIVALLLLLTYRSPVMWLIPLVSIGIGTVVAEALIYLLARHADLPVDGQSGGLLPIVLFGVGTDYALLLVARYREELHLHQDRHVAMAVALRRSAAPILASSATVTLAMACLLLADMNSTRSLGTVAAVGVACAALAILTVLPLLLVLLGRWVFWPRVPHADHVAGSADAVISGRSHWRRIADLVVRRPRTVWLGSVAALVLLATGWASTTLGPTQAESFRDVPDSVAGQQALARHFGAGSAAPVDVLVDSSAAARAEAALAATPGVQDVSQSAVSPDERRTLLTVTLGAHPDSEAAEETIADLRETLAALDANGLVGGAVAQRVDVAEASASDARTVIPAVFAVVLLVLLLLLRAVVGSLVLLGTVVLSYAAAMGAGALVLRATGFPAVDVSTPLLAFVFLVALGVDYTIFLMSRVREEVREHGHRAGVARGLVATGGVITSAGIVLAATFAVLLGMPIVFIVGVGAAVSTGILLDTFVVRTFLVPALATHLGPRFWWPVRVRD